MFLEVLCALGRKNWPEVNLANSSVDSIGTCFFTYHVCHWKFASSCHVKTWGLVSKMASIPWNHGGWRSLGTKAWGGPGFSYRTHDSIPGLQTRCKTITSPKKQITTSGLTSGNVDILQSTQLPAPITKHQRSIYSDKSHLRSLWHHCRPYPIRWRISPLVQLSNWNWWTNLQMKKNTLKFYE